eukprot:4904350-Pleurochrysis_carterae.AAC.1
MRTHPLELLEALLSRVSPGGALALQWPVAHDAEAFSLIAAAAEAATGGAGHGIGANGGSGDG